MQNNLKLFTASFPFGKKETYLNEEVNILSKYFDEITIYPLYFNDNSQTKRKTPKNVVVKNPALPFSKSKRILQVFIGLLRNPKLNVFFKDFVTNKVFFSLSKSKKWFIKLIEYLSTIGSSAYSELNHELCSDVYYFYWCTGWANILINKNIKNKTYTRVHGGEVFLDRSANYIPIISNILCSSNYLLPISKLLFQYLSINFNILNKKMIYSPLGVKSAKNINPINNESKIVIVSCSNVIKLKRIDLIINLLNHLKNKNIEWHHFGDGPLLNKIKMRSEYFSKNIKVKFWGQTENKEILKFYSEYPIDVFINLSLYEGLPVSIMEAIAHGIPVIATDVGATREIVSKENGYLLKKHFEIEKLIKIINSVKSVEWKKKRRNSYSMQNKKFNSEVNYRILVNILSR